jgi:hypothetical protein
MGDLMEADHDTTPVERHPVLQGLMDQAYDRWQANERLAAEYSPHERAAHMTKQQFQDSLDPRERLAVSVGNMNYQVENGGWVQWSVAGNGYGTPEVVDYLMEAMLRVGTDTCRQVHAMLRAFRAARVKHDLSERGWQRVCDLLDPLCTSFYAVNDKMLDDCEAYLARGGT